MNLEMGPLRKYLKLQDAVRIGTWDSPGGLVTKTPHSQCRGPGFDP